MRALAWILIALAAPSLWAEEEGNRAEYIGGTIAGVPHKGGTIHLTDPRSLRYHNGPIVIDVPYANINVLEYGQKVDRRYAMAVVISPLLLLSKKRRHFLTIGFADTGGDQQAMVFQVDKNRIRAVLASLEARTGLKVQFQDVEARKAGKG